MCEEYVLVALPHSANFRPPKLHGPVASLVRPSADQNTSGCRVFDVWPRPGDHNHQHATYELAARVDDTQARWTIVFERLKEHDGHRLTDSTTESGMMLPLTARGSCILTAAREQPSA